MYHDVRGREGNHDEIFTDNTYAESLYRTQWQLEFTMSTLYQHVNSCRHALHCNIPATEDMSSVAPAIRDRARCSGVHRVLEVLHHGAPLRDQAAENVRNDYAPF